MAGQFEADLEEFWEQARSNIIHYNYNDHYDIRLRYAVMYQLLGIPLLHSVVGNIVALPSFQEMDKEEDITILYGSYLDQPVQIYPKQEEGR